MKHKLGQNSTQTVLFLKTAVNTAESSQNAKYFE